MNAPTVQQQAIGLFAGIGVTLLVASLIGFVLKVAVAHGRPHGVIDNLNARIKAWWVIVAVIGLAFMLGGDGMLLLFAFVSFAALREFTSPVWSRGEHNAIATSFLVVLPAQYLLIHLGWFGMFSMFVPLCAFILMPMIATLAGDGKRFFQSAATIQWGLVICVFCVSHVPALLTLDIAGFEGRNLLLIVFLIVVVQSSDVLQYIWGKLCGRCKVAPLISPSKTWEGLIGGVASATALGAALFWITPFAPWQAALMALVINVMGVAGGLVLSAIKRRRGIKDWGRMIEGHGGMLDRLDSVVFAAPAFFYLARYGWA